MSFGISTDGNLLRRLWQLKYSSNGKDVSASVTFKFDRSWIFERTKDADLLGRQA
jgi:hypothetical protein